MPLTSNNSPILQVLWWASTVAAWTLLTSSPIALCQYAPGTLPDDVPFYSARATVTDRGNAAISPDGKTKVHIELQGDTSEYHPALVIVRTQHGKLVDKIQFGLDTEVVWSQDSQAFTVTGSIEGANGLYETTVFYVRESHLEKLNLTPLIKQAFGHPVKCGWPEPPNVAAIRWLIPSQQLLVAAEIIHHSNCDSFGTFTAYVVDLSGPRIAKIYNQLDTKRLFGGDLGRELRQADDKCIHNPRACYVPSNHPEMKPAP